MLFALSEYTAIIFLQMSYCNWRIPPRSKCFALSSSVNVQQYLFPVIRLGISFPDGNVTRSGRISFVLGVWLPLGLFKGSVEVPGTISH